MSVRSMLIVLGTINITAVCISYIFAHMDVHPLLIIFPLVMLLLISNTVLIMKIHDIERYIREWDENERG